MQVYTNIKNTTPYQKPSLYPTDKQKQKSQKIKSCDVRDEYKFSFSAELKFFIITFILFKFFRV